IGEILWRIDVVMGVDASGHLVHLSAMRPARAICSSWLDCTPETPIAPTHSPSWITGTAPWISEPAGELPKAGRSLTRASQNLVGCLVSAEALAFSGATVAEIAGAPSMRSRLSSTPASSTTAIVTFQWFFSASARQAASICRASDDVRQSLVRMDASPRGGDW